MNIKYLFLLCCLFCSAIADEKKNPVSKAYITSVQGDVSILQEGVIQDLATRETYDAAGVVFDTKEKSNQSMVLSNGSGVYMGEYTHLEIKKFVQEPFTPNRTDADVEPSISQTRGYISRGEVAICTSKIVAGSNMEYETPNGKIKLFGNKVYINVGDNGTNVISIEGEFGVEVGPSKFERVKTGQKAEMKNGNFIIVKPTEKEFKDAVEHITTACNAKKEVYFDIKKEVGEKLEIIATKIIDKKLPVQFTVSPASIP